MIRALQLLKCALAASVNYASRHFFLSCCTSQKSRGSMLYLWVVLTDLCNLTKPYVMTKRKCCWRSSGNNLCSDCDSGHGPVTHLLGGVSAWREDDPLLLLSLSTDHLGDRNWDSSVHCNPCNSLMGSTVMPRLAEFSEVLQRSLCRSWSWINRRTRQAFFCFILLSWFLIIWLWDLFAPLSIQDKFSCYQERINPSSV